MQGYWGRILDIDVLTRRAVAVEVGDAVRERFIGGRGLGARLLGERLAPGVDPLAPDNVVMFLRGPLTASPAPGSSKFVVVTRSPLTGAFLDSYSSGTFAVELSHAGFDGLLLRGAAPEPVYLWVDGDRVEFRPAAHLWGVDTFTAEAAIIAETSPEAGAVVIGPAGENLARFACINADRFRQAGRGGAGAVLGSKRVKGIAIRGSRDLPLADAAAMLEKAHRDALRAAQSNVAKARRRFGTPLTLDITNAAGMLPTLNFQAGTCERATGRLDAAGVERQTLGSRACYACFIACSKVTAPAAGGGDHLEGPEYETLGMLGPNLGITDLDAVIDLNLRCDRLGLDTISTGAVISFAAECAGRGLLQGLLRGHGAGAGPAPAFGDAAGAAALIEDIARRRGLGAVLADGAKRAAERIGGGSERFAMHVKGMEFPAYDPRAAWGAGLAYAVSPRGACHRRAWPPAREVLGDLPPFVTEGKAQAVKELYDYNCVVHSLLLCDMPGKFVPLGLGDYAEYLSLAVGRTVTEADLLLTAERVETQIRLFNNRQGFTRRDDALPPRILDEALPDGPPRGQRLTRAALDTMLDEYYRLRGWDNEGRPLAETLRRLGL